MVKTLSQCKHGHLDRTLEIEMLAKDHNLVVKRSCPHCGDPMVAVLSYPV